MPRGDFRRRARRGSVVALIACVVASLLFTEAGAQPSSSSSPSDTRSFTPSISVSPSVTVSASPSLSSTSTSGSQSPTASLSLSNTPTLAQSGGSGPKGPGAYDVVAGAVAGTLVIGTIIVVCAVFCVARRRARERRLRGQARTHIGSFIPGVPRGDRGLEPVGDPLPVGHPVAVSVVTHDEVRAARVVGAVSRVNAAAIGAPRRGAPPGSRVPRMR